MKESLLDIVTRLNDLNGEDLADAVTQTDDVQWCLSELRDILGIIGDMSVDHLREMVQADREGRCVVLPCKAGDTFYRGDEKYKADHWNVVLTAIFWAGERKNITLLYPEEVGNVLEEMEDAQK